MRPLDNMQCAAVAVEVSPQDEDTTAEDNGYQGQISSAVANTLLLWRNKVASLAPPEPTAAACPVRGSQARVQSLQTAPKPADKRGRAMIPRYQRILFAILLGSSVVMAVLLVYLHQRNFAAVKNADNTPLEAPVYSASEDVPLLIANDSDGSVKQVTRSIALPQQSAVRARALLEHLLAEYTLPRSTHPIGGGVAVEDVYLVPLPLGAPARCRQPARGLRWLRSPAAASRAEPIP